MNKRGKTKKKKRTKTFLTIRRNQNKINWQRKVDRSKIKQRENVPTIKNINK